MVNDFATPKITGTVLSTNNELIVNSLTYNFSNFAIATNPDTIQNIGDPRWKVNGVTGYQEIKTDESTYPAVHVWGYAQDDILVIENVPSNVTIQVFNLTGNLIYSAITDGTTFRHSLETPCIVRLFSDKFKPIYLKIR
jgi:hypothetical protein